MFKLVLLFGLAAIAFAADHPSITPTLTPASLLNQNYYRNQLYGNQFNPYNTYTGNKFYQPNQYRYNQPGYFEKDYQRYNPGNYYNKDHLNRDYYNKDFYNRNNYNNEYYQKYNNDGKSAGILRFVNDAQPDGSYQYGFETQNGISAEQQGVVRVAADQTTPVVVQGFYRFTSPEGIPVDVKYTADEFGYHPQGSVISGQGRAYAYKNGVIPAVEVN